MRLSHVAAALGHRFWQDPRLRSRVSAAMATGRPADRRAGAMIRETKAWLRALWLDDDLCGFADRLANGMDGGEGPRTSTLLRVLPGHRRVLSAAENDQLFDWLDRVTPAPFRDGGPRHLAYMACALVHGPQWPSDPQYPRLAAAVASGAEPARLAADIRRIYLEADG
ncbi:hypothetical protein [Jannaschia sp. LMIT008]|uniref:hypothetical protein n=1 Tax=Jannaschia maritima TaxID=3032585 RepID=UPI002810E8FA|nr:hypothetical protein [Jannaschia sp. LMIT008]